MHYELECLLFIPGAIAASGGFIEDLKPVYLQGVTCTGSENSLLSCSFATTANSACTRRSIADVICQGAQNRSYLIAGKFDGELNLVV